MTQQNRSDGLETDVCTLRNLSYGYIILREIWTILYVDYVWTIL